MPIDEDLETWADVGDVFRFTGEEVTELDLTRAQDTIDLISGTTFAARPHISPRNLRCLNRAVAYQAAWIKDHPDLYTHTDLASITLEGASATPASENARLLAPFADRWLRRLTWRHKPLRVRGRYGASDSDTPRDSAVADDNRIWSPL